MEKKITKNFHLWKFIFSCSLFSHLNPACLKKKFLGDESFCYNTKRISEKKFSKFKLISQSRPVFIARQLYHYDSEIFNFVQQKFCRFLWNYLTRKLARVMNFELKIVGELSFNWNSTFEM